MVDHSRVDCDGRAYAGSQRQIQTYVNQFPEVLNSATVGAFRTTTFPADRHIRWVSPLKWDRYTEYCDGEFLRALGLERFKDELSEFWPDGGPHWDALGRVEDRCEPVVYIMIEAKSHVREFYGRYSRATGDALHKIEAALIRTAESLKVNPNTRWLNPPNKQCCLYQCENRLAHLFFLRETCHVQAFLLNVMFTNDPHSPTRQRDWDEALPRIHEELGVQEFPDCCAELFLPAIRRPTCGYNRNQS